MSNTSGTSQEAGIAGRIGKVILQTTHNCCSAINKSAASAALVNSLSEKARGEVIQTTTPREPFVSRAGRLVIHVLDSRIGQLFAELFRAGAFGGSDAEEQDFHLLIDRTGICKYAIVSSL